MDILRLIISIIMPPVGLLISFLIGEENRIQRIAKIISIVLSLLFLVGIISIFVILAGSKSYDDIQDKCRKAYKCDKSDDEYQKCYYCRDDNCKRVDTIICPNNYQDIFNYDTEAGEDEE